jgi:hypothetical protein
MEVEGLLPSSQKPATGPYSESDEVCFSIPVACPQWQLYFAQENFKF